METITAKRPWANYVGDVPLNLEYFEGSMFDKVAEVAAKYPDHVAFDFMGRSTTYRQLIQEIENCAKALKTIGLREATRSRSPCRTVRRPSTCFTRSTS